MAKADKQFEQRKFQPITRSVEIDRAAADESARTVPLSFASETPCYEPEVGGMVILDHSPGSVDFSRMEGGPVFVQHNDADQVAVAESCTISADRKSRAIARFSKATRASEIFQDVKDGIRRQVSVRAVLNKLVIDSVADGMTTYRAVSWTPREISIVGLAKDATVGINRDAKSESFETQIEVVRQEPDPKPNPLPEPKVMNEQEIKTQIETARGDALNAERKRITDISGSVDALLKTYPEAKETFRALENKAIKEGQSHADFNMALLAALPGVRTVTREETPAIGLTEKETKRFSLMRALNALVTKEWKDAGFELECSRAVEKIAGSPKHGGFYVPYEVQARQPEAKRDQTVASATGGGYLVSTMNQAGSFIELLRNRTLIAQLGARILPGLRDNVTIPKQSAASTAYWLASESTSITESAITLGQLALTPKTVGAYVEISRLTMLQSNPSIDGLVMDDLAKVVGIAVDLAAINGGGSAEPQGIIGTSGVGSVTGASFAYADALEFQTDLAGANALAANCALITTPSVAAVLAEEVKFANTASPLWEGNLLDGTVCGFRAAATLQVPTGYAIFGDFSQLVIGEWGILEIAMNPYANFTAGIVGVRAFQTVDVGLRNAGAFSVASSVS